MWRSRSRLKDGVIIAEFGVRLYCSHLTPSHRVPGWDSVASTQSPRDNIKCWYPPCLVWSHFGFAVVPLVASPPAAEGHAAGAEPQGGQLGAGTGRGRPHCDQCVVHRKQCVQKLNSLLTMPAFQMHGEASLLFNYFESGSSQGDKTTLWSIIIHGCPLLLFTQLLISS